MRASEIMQREAQHAREALWADTHGHDYDPMAWLDETAATIDLGVHPGHCVHCLEALDHGDTCPRCERLMRVTGEW